MYATLSISDLKHANNFMQIASNLCFCLFVDLHA